jgi:hypothetical protein
MQFDKEIPTENENESQVRELHELELAYVGGGIGETSL